VATSGRESTNHALSTAFPQETSQTSRQWSLPAKPITFSSSKSNFDPDEIIFAAEGKLEGNRGAAPSVSGWCRYVVEIRGPSPSSHETDARLRDTCLPGRHTFRLRLHARDGIKHANAPFQHFGSDALHFHRKVHDGPAYPIILTRLLLAEAVPGSRRRRAGNRNPKLLAFTCSIQVHRCRAFVHTNRSCSVTPYRTGCARLDVVFPRQCGPLIPDVARDLRVWNTRPHSLPVWPSFLPIELLLLATKNFFPFTKAECANPCWLPPCDARLSFFFIAPRANWPRINSSAQLVHHRLARALPANTAVQPADRQRLPPERFTSTEPDSSRRPTRRVSLPSCAHVLDGLLNIFKAYVVVFFAT